ncbi:MAG: DUF3391 domain-containing protein [Nitrospira sp.]
MTKRIGIDELQPGMLIEQLDRSWLSTPFFRHTMTITSHQQIAQLKACGVQTLVVRIDAEEVRETPAPEQELADDSNVPVVEEPVSAPPVVPLRRRAGCCETGVPGRQDRHSRRHA